MRKNKFFVVLILIIFSSPVYCYANAGIIMIGNTWSIIGLTFIPVFIVEILYYKKKTNKKFNQILKPVLYANIESSIIGIPLAWIYNLAMQIIILLCMAGVNLLLNKLFSIDFNNYFSYSNFDNINIFGWFVFAVSFSAIYPPPIFNQTYPNWISVISSTIGLLIAYYVSIKIEKKVIGKYWCCDDNALIYRLVKNANKLSYIFVIFPGLFIKYFYNFG